MSELLLRKRSLIISRSLSWKNGIWTTSFFGTFIAFAFFTRQSWEQPKLTFVSWIEGYIAVIKWEILHTKSSLRNSRRSNRNRKRTDVENRLIMYIKCSKKCVWEVCTGKGRWCSVCGVAYGSGVVVRVWYGVGGVAYCRCSRSGVVWCDGSINAKRLKLSGARYGTVRAMVIRCRVTMMAAKYE